MKAQRMTVHTKFDVPEKRALHITCGSESELDLLIDAIRHTGFGDNVYAAVWRQFQDAVREATG